jgi:hypothetical protein
MGVSDILQSIDREIEVLKQARALIAGSTSTTGRKVGRPKKSVALVAAPAPVQVTVKKKKKRRLSPEGRKRIAEAVKRRWEAQRKAASAK